jgi:hypothetical protein
VWPALEPSATHEQLALLRVIWLRCVELQLRDQCSLFLREVQKRVRLIAGVVLQAFQLNRDYNQGAHTGAHVFPLHHDYVAAVRVRRLRRPKAVTISMLVQKATGGLAELLRDRMHRSQILHRIADAGYEMVRSSTAKDGLWKVAGKRQSIYAPEDLSPRMARVSLECPTSSDSQCPGGFLAVLQVESPRGVQLGSNAVQARRSIISMSRSNAPGRVA